MLAGCIAPTVALVVAALSTTFSGLAGVASAASTARNPLAAVGVVRNADILTPSHRVTALSHFDLAFDLSATDTRVRLKLEPNHDVFVEGAKVSYVDVNGEIKRQEPIDPLAHRVYRGTAWVKSRNGWDQAGWARVSIQRDGREPLFEGAFTLHGKNHHVQLASHYQRARHSQDPEVRLGDEDYMVAYSDSDFTADEEHNELRKRGGDARTCLSDDMDFNRDPDHPVFAGMRNSSETVSDDYQSWLSPFSPFSSFSKRQIDNPGGGNGAGVNLVSTIGSTQGCPQTRKVALVGIAADCNYRADFRDENATRANIIQQINAASNVFESQFSISLGLANLIITDASCPTSPQQATAWNQACNVPNFNISQRLSSFSEWRGKQDDGYSHWTLLSKCNTDSAVGLAWLGQACTAGSQPNNGNQNELVAGANFVARISADQEWQIIAHETGHTFGAVHDCDTRLCQRQDIVRSQGCCPLNSGTCNAGGRFIMNPSTSAGDNQFSPCSVGNICSALGRNSVKSTCLTNNRNVETIMGQTCGNGIVEGDEECDCGGEAGCGDNACCDAQTCKFKENAVCDDSNEDCCRNCQFASADTVCRASNGECDPEEKCTGDSPYCPKDEVKNDGDSCDGGKRCASGQCTSRDEQCRSVLGTSSNFPNSTKDCPRFNECMMLCQSPEWPDCASTGQYYLDGTPCESGGKCRNVCLHALLPIPLPVLLLVCTCTDHSARATVKAAASAAGSKNTNPSLSASQPASVASLSSPYSAAAGGVSAAAIASASTLLQPQRARPATVIIATCPRKRRWPRRPAAEESAEELARHQAFPMRHPMDHQHRRTVVAMEGMGAGMRLLLGRLRCSKMEVVLDSVAISPRRRPCINGDGMHRTLASLLSIFIPLCMLCTYRHSLFLFLLSTGRRHF